MKKLIVALLLLWIPYCAQAAEVDAAIGGVALMRVDIYSGSHLSGAYYFALNTNSYPVYVYIYLTQAYLTIDGLNPNYVHIEPGGQAYLGYVMRQDYHMPFHWYYRWKVVPE